MTIGLQLMVVFIEYIVYILDELIKHFGRWWLRRYRAGRPPSRRLVVQSPAPPFSLPEYPWDRESAAHRCTECVFKWVNGKTVL